MGVLAGAVLAFFTGVFSYKISFLVTFILTITAGIIIMVSYQNDLKRRFGAEANNREYESRKDSSAKVGSGTALFFAILGAILKATLFK